MIARLVLTFAIVTAVMASASPALALDLEAEMQGWRGSSEPFSVEVTAFSDVFFTGTLKVAVGTVRVFEAVELPAGTEKVWSVDLPPSVGATRATVQLLDDQGEQVERVLIQLPSGSGESVLVGALDIPVEVRAAINDARTAPTQTVPVVEELTGVADLAGYDYLALGRVLTAEERGVVEEWIEDGGRLVGAEDVLVGFSATWGSWGEITIGTVGSGEVVLLAAEAFTDPSAWGLALRPRGSGPSAMLNREFGGEDPYSSLGTAAAGSASNLALIPWLLGAMGAYVLIAGPVNIFVLRRLKRPELGWVTVPALALLGVLGLWFFGPRQSTIITYHATIVEQGQQTRSAFSLVSSNDTEEVIQLTDATLLATVQDFLPSVRATGDDTLTVELQTGRSAVMYSEKEAPTGGMTAVVDGNEVTLRNDTGLVFEQWGVAAGSLVVGANGEWASGTEYGFTVQGVVNQDPWEPLLMPQLWNDVELNRGNAVWQVYRPLLASSERLVGGIRTESFAWGLTAQDGAEIAVGGRSRNVEGVTLWLARIDLPPELVEADGRTVLTTDGMRSEGPFFYWGFGSITMEFLVDPDAEEIAVRDNFGGFGRQPLRFDLFNPESGEWDSFDEVGEIVSADPYVLPTGVVYVRIVTQEDREIDLQGLSVGVVR